MLWIRAFALTRSVEALERLTRCCFQTQIARPVAVLEGMRVGTVDVEKQLLDDETPPV